MFHPCVPIRGANARAHQIMESYCLFLMGSFVALPAFRRKYGIPDGSGGYVLESAWQSALQVGGPLGALIGVFIAGPITSKIGYRYATILGVRLALLSCLSRF
jgi:SP family general alpha glucoside:H+ symporter-like MFS transporter